ncbi:MAG: hypothetical protein HC932_01975 [Thermales bacterium]|nr:hypothetical protein [Thermales bacterium]
MVGGFRYLGIYLLVGIFITVIGFMFGYMLNGFAKASEDRTSGFTKAAEDRHKLDIKITSVQIMLSMLVAQNSNMTYKEVIQKSTEEAKESVK